MRRAFIAVSVMLTIAVIAPFEWARHTARGRVHDSIDTVPAMPIALVLGAGLLPDGRPSPMLADRVNAAVDLYEQGVVTHLLFSGDNSRADYDEPTSMRWLALRRGVHASAITLDFAGFSTLDSCARASSIFGVSRAVVVTQDFHATRAVALCRAHDVDAAALSVSSAHHPANEVRALRVREGAATFKAFGDFLRDAPPKFEGDFVGLPGSASLPAINAAWAAKLG